MRYPSGLKLHYMDCVVASKKLQEVPGLVDLINTRYAKQPEAERFHHGLVLVGEKGWIAGEYMGLYGSSLGDYVALMKTQLPSRTKEVQRSAGGHNSDFIAAIRERRQPVADFASTFNSDQIPVLVDLLGRTQSRFKWDPQRCEVLDCPAAAKFINRPMREPWHSAVYKVA